MESRDTLEALAFMTCPYCDEKRTKPAVYEDGGPPTHSIIVNNRLSIVNCTVPEVIVRLLHMTDRELDTELREALAP